MTLFPTQQLQHQNSRRHNSKRRVKQPYQSDRNQTRNERSLQVVIDFGAKSSSLNTMSKTLVMKLCKDISPLDKRPGNPVRL